VRLSLFVYLFLSPYIAPVTRWWHLHCTNKALRAFTCICAIIYFLLMTSTFAAGSFFFFAETTSNVNGPSVEQQDITVYCAGYLDTAIFVMALEGLILRLATLAAIYFCPRGITLEPVVIAAGTFLQRIRNAFRRKPKRRTITTNVPVQNNNHTV
jgi:hypothetical protein